MPAAVFGPVIDATRLERKTIACLKKWLSTYLAEFEDAHPDYVKGQILRPRSWQSDIDVRKFPDDQLPAIVVVVGDEEPIVEADSISMAYVMAIGVLVKGTSRQRGRDVARVYAAAIRLAVTHKGGEIADALEPGTASYSEQRGNPGKVAAVASVPFTVLVNDVIDPNAGPAIPDPLPFPPDGSTWPDYPDGPEADTVTVTLTPEIEE